MQVSKNSDPIQEVSIEIDMTDVVLVHQVGLSSIQFNGVSNIHWHGATVVYDHPNFCQGTVLSVDGSRRFHSPVA